MILSPARACGRAPVGPEPTIDSNASSSAPSSWKSRGDVPGDVALAAADERHLAHEPLEHPVGDRAAAPERVELALVLDRAQLLDEALARHEIEAAFAQLLGEREREDVRLEADPAGEVVGEPRR